MSTCLKLFFDSSILENLKWICFSCTTFLRIFFFNGKIVVCIRKKLETFCLRSLSYLPLYFHSWSVFNFSFVFNLTEIEGAIKKVLLLISGIQRARPQCWGRTGRSDGPFPYAAFWKHQRGSLMKNSCPSFIEALFRDRKLVSDPRLNLTGLPIEDFHEPHPNCHRPALASTQFLLTHHPLRFPRVKICLIPSNSAEYTLRRKLNIYLLLNFCPD